MTYDVNDLAGQVFPIVGAGIGLGVLAEMSRGVTETMFPSRYTRKSLRKPRTMYGRRGYYQPPYRPRVQYGYWR
jgi:hypothetical protein